ncbi:hypothetical protein [Pseudomonas sp. ANT_J28]|uniref:hypothetical protein n=1 Tax=Pseudomonas sp. ANT_J28 TaxID=2597352 RepID=UPI0015B58990|nr:hypothetical protein [Pseudomonas sp. ANT_J28]
MIEVMITVVNTTEVMTMIADMIVVTMIRGMNAITVVIVIVTIETTERAGHRLSRNGGDRLSSGRSIIAWFAY